MNVRCFHPWVACGLYHRCPGSACPLAATHATRARLAKVLEAPDLDRFEEEGDEEPVFP
jgi:hypothetical protein